MKTYDQLVAEIATQITELMPWDLAEKLESNEQMLMVDVREAEEFKVMHIPDTINIPRGILESASEPGYDESHPGLSSARDQQVVVICRSGKRSCLAAYSLQVLGFNAVYSLKSGLRGWNDYDQILVDQDNQEIDGDDAEEFLKPKVVEP
ncbi:MAG: rhodanese-like domain-containing protein [Pseudomonadota bacterium]